MKKTIILILSFTPLFTFAEGQYGLGIFLDVFDFIKVFSIWGITVFVLIRIFNSVNSNKLGKQYKKFIWLGTGLIALFIWSMIKHDSNPYSGPIDSLFNKNLTIDDNESHTAGVIEYVFDSEADSSGVYVWKDDVKVFVRKLTNEEQSTKSINILLTKDILRNNEKLQH